MSEAFQQLMVMSPEVVVDRRRGELLVLERRSSGLVRVAPAADPDMDYWISLEHLDLRPNAKRSDWGTGVRKHLGNPGSLIPATPVGCIESEPWFKWLWEHASLYLNWFDGPPDALDWCRRKWFQETGGEALDEGCGFVYRKQPSTHPKFAKCRHALYVVYFGACQYPLPEGLKQVVHSAEGCMGICSTPFCWSLVRAGFRLGRRRAS